MEITNLLEFTNRTQLRKWLALKDLQTVRWLPADEDFVNEMCDFAKQSYQNEEILHFFG